MVTYKIDTTHTATISIFVSFAQTMKQWKIRGRIYLESHSGCFRKVADKKLLLVEGDNKIIFECKMPKVKKATEYKVNIALGNLFLIGRWYIGKPAFFFQGIETLILKP